MKKIILRLFNLVYIALAAVACVALFTKPLVSIEGTIALNKDQLTELIYKDNLAPKEGKEQQFNISQEDWDNAIAKSLDSEGKLSFKVSLEIPASSAISKDSSVIADTVTKKVNESVNEMVDKLGPAVKELAKSIAKNEGAKAIKSSIESQIKVTNPESDAAKIMADCHIDDAYIDKMTDSVLDDLLGNPDEEIEPVKTVDELMGRIEDDISDICHKLSEGGVAGYEEEGLDEKILAMNDDVEAQLEKALQDANLCDEDGNILDIDAAIDELLSGLLDGMLNGDSSGEQPKEETKSPGRVTRAEGTSSEEQESKLNQKIREIINKYIEQFKINDFVQQFSYVPLLFVMFLILPWLAFILLTLLRTIRKNKIWTKSWIVFVFAAIQVVLGIVLYLAVAKFSGQLLGYIPVGNEDVSKYIAILEQSTIGIQTCMFIPSIMYLVMIPLTIVYIILAHKVKKEYKKTKREKRSAKKSA